MVYTGTPRRGASPQTLRSRGYLPGSGGSSSRKKTTALEIFLASSGSYYVLEDGLGE